MDIRILPAFHYPTEIKELFSEYTQTLIDGDPEIQKYLSIQNYEKELEHPEAKYGPPAGRLYLAFCEGSPAGCIGLRPLESPGCEMKRLYVRPAFRKNHIAIALSEQSLKMPEKSAIPICYWIPCLFCRMPWPCIKNMAFMKFPVTMIAR